MKKTTLLVNKILLEHGWANQQTITIENGIITNIRDTNIRDTDIHDTDSHNTKVKEINAKKSGVNNSQVIEGIVIPGMINCHSHAFQRALAGFSEQGSGTNDSFWTWRNVMYKFLDQLSVTDIELIATQLYIEMLKAGYTRVAEFHYLHHQKDGTPFLPLSTMAHAIFKAANKANIGLTLLPVLYQFSGFGATPANKGQLRFINTIDSFNHLVSDCFDLSKEYNNTNIGIAPHSLRAVDKQSLLDAIRHVRTLNKNAPIHIHIAEQQQEVTECIAFYGQRPVEWLLNNVQLDKHWCLIHATHITEIERKGIIASKAIAGICPTTEANLGDGIFPMVGFLAEGGNFAIGSDSNISVNPIEELKWLEYGQRLSQQKRALLSAPSLPSVGQHLWQSAAKGGAQSTDSNTGVIAVGKQADLLVIDQKQTRLFASNNQHLLDSIIFASQHNIINDVMVNGEWVVQAGKHAHEQDSADKFAELLTRLST